MWCTLQSHHLLCKDFKRCCALYLAASAAVLFELKVVLSTLNVMAPPNILWLQMLSWINFNNFFEADPGSAEWLKQKCFAHIIQGLKWSIGGLMYLTQEPLRLCVFSQNIRHPPAFQHMHVHTLRSSTISL